MTSMFNETLLAGETALVTGGSSGLGAHFARVLAAHGATVVVTGRRADALEATVSSIRDAGGRAEAVTFDVRDAGSVEKGIEDAVAKAGPISVLVNNSGVAVSKRFEQQTEEDWSFVIDTNLSGAYRVGSRVVRRMIEGGIEGRVVNVGSIVGLATAGHLTAYAASKAGLLHLTRTMAVELARHRIRVNALAPGYFGTELNATFFDSEAGRAMLGRVPMRRLGDPAELDAPLLLLASKASSFITGSVVTVDGGHSIHPL